MSGNDDSGSGNQRIEWLTSLLFVVALGLPAWLLRAVILWIIGGGHYMPTLVVSYILFVVVLAIAALLYVAFDEAEWPRKQRSLLFLSALFVIQPGWAEFQLPLVATATAPFLAVFLSGLRTSEEDRATMAHPPIRLTYARVGVAVIGAILFVNLVVPPNTAFRCSLSLGAETEVATSTTMIEDRSALAQYRNAEETGNRQLADRILRRNRSVEHGTEVQVIDKDPGHQAYKVRILGDSSAEGWVSEHLLCSLD